jgi:uncharacterized membrane protein
LLTRYHRSTAEAGLIPFAEAPFETFPATKIVSGTTTTLSTSAAAFANQGFDCVRVFISDAVEEGASIITFPITAPPASVPAPALSVAVPSAVTAPAPAALSIATPKPLKLKVGKSKTIKIKVSNTGATAAGKGTLEVKAPTGVLVRPGKQQIPALPPGGSSTLSIRVELTAKAKAKSTSP